MRPVRIAVVGAGLIGRRHIEEVQANLSTELAAVVDPAAAGAELAQQANVPAYASLAGLFGRRRAGNGYDRTARPAGPGPP